MTTIVFIGVDDAGCSPMAAVLFNALAHGNRARATSAGLRRAERVHPEVVEVMRELGADLSQGRPRRFAAELGAQGERVITIGCGEECATLVRVRSAEWSLPDPHGCPLEQVREIRDELLRRVTALVVSEGW